MTTPLSDAELDHLLGFIGYRTLDADDWFLGMEEAGGGEANLRTRLKFRKVEDNAEAHRKLGVPHLHWETALLAYVVQPPLRFQTLGGVARARGAALQSG